MLDCRFGWMISAGAALAIVTTVHGEPCAQFIGLGDLSGGAIRSAAHAVNSDGSVVVGAAEDWDGNTPFRWTEEDGMDGHGICPFFPTVGWANGVSADGTFMVGYDSGTDCGEEAFVWSESTGFVEFRYLPFGVSSTARGVTADGSVVVGMSGDGSGVDGNEAYYWTEATGLVGLGFLPGGDGSVATAITPDGSVIVGSSTVPPSGELAFRWTESDGMVSIGDLPGGSTSSRALAVSTDGSVIVGSSDSVTFRWTQSTGMVSLGTLPGGAWSKARGVSGDGSLVVGTGEGSSGGRAFLWSEADGMRAVDDVLTDLGVDLMGWSLTNCNGISADGSTIVGSGVDASGGSLAWIARIPSLVDCNGNGTPDSCEVIVGFDADADGTVDLDDFNHFGECLFGPGTTPNPTSGECAGFCLSAFDHDDDVDVDLDDFARMALEF